MKLSCEWLREYVAFDLSPAELAERLTTAGLPCESIEAVGADTVLSVEVPSNRPDCLGLLGLAREVATITGGEFRIPEAAPARGGTQAATLARVTVEDQELCPRYVARVVSGVRPGASPDWMQRRLAAVGLRALSNVVDITNYVLIETGQPPLHPVGALGHLDAADHPGHVAGAELLVLDGDARQRAGRGPAALGDGQGLPDDGGHLAGQPQHSQAVRPVGGHLHGEHPVLADRFQALAGQPDGGEPCGQLLGRELALDVLAEPLAGQAHQNCSRKRRSFSRNRRMSLMP